MRRLGWSFEIDQPMFTSVTKDDSRFLRTKSQEFEGYDIYFLFPEEKGDFLLWSLSRDDDFSESSYRRSGPEELCGSSCGGDTYTSEGDPWWYMGVSKNNGTSKSSILIGFSIINHPLWGFSPYFGNIHIWIQHLDTKKTPCGPCFGVGQTGWHGAWGYLSF